MNSNYSVDDLLGWLSGKSKTHGWGAIVAYDRRKTNQLLNQLYIERFNSTSWLPLIDESIEVAEDTYEHITGLQLSVPKLSFQDANLDLSRASLTMDIVGGLIMSETGSPGGASFIYKIQKVLPVGGPQLSMTLDLHNSNGTVVANGDVILDISAGRDYSANFVMGDIPAENIGTRFKEIFTGLDPKQKVFPLGRLAGDLNGVLTPDGFVVRTMAAPGAKNRSAANYGDGAVLMFVRLKGGIVGNTPGNESDFMYPIPADKAGKEYTGSILLSSKVVMNELFKSHIESEVGNNLELTPNTTSIDLAVKLQASKGGWKAPDVNLSVGSPFSAQVKSLAPLVFPFNGSKRFTVSGAAGGLLEFSWGGDARFPFYFAKQNLMEDPKEEQCDVRYTHDQTFFLKGVVDLASGIVSFVPGPGSTRSGTVEKIGGEIDFYYSFHNAMEGALHGMLDAIHALLPNISLPAVDTFLIRNLLFSGQNAMRLHDAYIPGDLALFGFIDPERTSATVSPSNPIIEAGGSQRFTVAPGLTSPVWSLRGTTPGDSNVGSIDNTGLYKAPPSGSLPKGYQTVVVTVKGRLGTQDVTASALISVLATSITLSPIFRVCDPGKSFELTAETLQGGAPTWSLANPAQGAKLDAKGKACTFTAGPQNSELPDAFLNTIIVKNPATNATAQAQILVLNRALGMAMTVSKDSKPETGQVQLMVDYGDGPELPGDEVVLTLQVGAGGSISPSGVYKEAANATGFAVISAVAGTGSRRDPGFIVLPLPLAVYGDATRRVSDSLSLHSSRAPRP